MRVTLRRQRSKVFRKTKPNLRAAIEATVRAIRHPFPKGKLPVRGRFRIFYLMIGSAAMNNVRQIQRYLRSKEKKELSISFSLRFKNLFFASSCLFQTAFGS